MARRPRWHDALIVVAIIGLLAGGVWALWWDDVRAALHLGPGSAADEPGPRCRAARTSSHHSAHTPPASNPMIAMTIRASCHRGRLTMNRR